MINNENQKDLNTFLDLQYNSKTIKMLGCLGKILIVIGLCFQAYLLLENPTISKQFNTKLLSALSSCESIPSHIAGYLNQFGRYVVVGLLGSSAIILVCSFWGIKLFAILGLVLQTYILHQPFTKLPCVGCTAFWEKIAMIGALIYLMARDCEKNQNSGAQVNIQNKEQPAKIEKSKQPEKSKQNEKQAKQLEGDNKNKKHN